MIASVLDKVDREDVELGAVEFVARRVVLVVSDGVGLGVVGLGVVGFTVLLVGLCSHS